MLWQAPYKEDGRQTKSQTSSRGEGGEDTERGCVLQIIHCPDNEMMEDFKKTELSPTNSFSFNFFFVFLPLEPQMLRHFILKYYIFYIDFFKNHPVIL